MKFLHVSPRHALEGSSGLAVSPGCCLPSSLLPPASAPSLLGSAPSRPSAAGLLSQGCSAPPPSPSRGSRWLHPAGRASGVLLPLGLCLALVSSSAGEDPEESPASFSFFLNGTLLSLKDFLNEKDVPGGCGTFWLHIDPSGGGTGSMASPPPARPCSPREGPAAPVPLRQPRRSSGDQAAAQTERPLQLNTSRLLARFLQTVCALCYQNSCRKAFMLLHITPFKEVCSALFHAVITASKCWHNLWKHNMSVHLISNLP